MEYWILAALYWLAAMTTAVTPMHMYQLSSYQAQGYFRWLTGASEKVIMRQLPVALLALAGLFGGYAIPYIGMGLVLLLGLLNLPRRDVKKPFKLTARVLRQFVVLGLLLALMAVGAVLLRGVSEQNGSRYMFVLLAAGHIGLFWLVPVSGWICLPLQRLVNGRYIRDAKRILRAKPALKIIGITGSYGKTSTKFFLGQLLGVKYNTLVTPESYNTPMGIVRAIRENMDASHQVFVCEMGARHVGDIRECCDIVQPQWGVITSLGPQHLETFKSMENIVATKFELIDALPADGLAFLPAGSEHANRPVDRTVVRFGLAPEHDAATPPPDYAASDIQVTREGTRFTLRCGTEEQSFRMPLLGRHNVENLCAAIAVAHKMGLSLAELAPAVRALRAVPHRLELKPYAEGVTLIDDAYNANPQGVRAALDTLRLFDEVRILVTPGMVELGATEEEENREFGCLAAGSCDYVALVGKKQTEPILAGLREGGLDKARAKAFDNFQAAFQWALQLDTAGRGRVILLENDLPDQY